MLRACGARLLSQEDAVRGLKGSAVLALEALEAAHEQPPEPLANAASLLHDHCMLVRGGVAGGLTWWGWGCGVGRAKAGKQT